MTKVTLAMGAACDGWLSSELYLEHLHGALAALAPDGWEFAAWSSGASGPAWLRRRVCYPLDLRRRVRGNLHLVDQSYADALLAYGGGPSVVTVADIAFWRERGTNPLRGLTRARIAAGLGRARRIIAISATTAHELETELGIAPERIRVVPFAIDPAYFFEPEALSQEMRKRIGAGPFLLHVGSLDARKGLERFLAAFRLAPELPPLVQAGGTPDAALRARIAAAGLAGRVHFLGKVDRPVLHSLYGAAEALVFPSSYEGFGVPPLEARAAGARLLTTPMPSVTEALGEKAALDPAGSAEDWAEAVLQTLMRPRPGGFGKAERARFSWERAARDTLAVYREAFA